MDSLDRDAEWMFALCVILTLTVLIIDVFVSLTLLVMEFIARMYQVIAFPTLVTMAHVVKDLTGVMTASAFQGTADHNAKISADHVYSGLVQMEGSVFQKGTNASAYAGLRTKLRTVMLLSLTDVSQTLAKMAANAHS